MNRRFVMTAGLVCSLMAVRTPGVRADPPPGPSPPAPAPAPSSEATRPADATDVLADDSLFELEELTITKQVVAPERAAGSAHRVDSETLEKLEYDDPHNVLLTVPGVYVRTEDAFGLRPNIGMRGASADRSKKITLMEDGVLLAPAPYSAPAAYYFPLMTRITEVEVWKGPSAIRFGPHTVGGAVNLRSREIPDAPRAALDVAGGMYGYGKAHGWVGASHGAFGALLEGAYLRSDGFKALDGGGDTGFDRGDLRLKLRAQSDPHAEVVHRAETLFGYEREVSNETYLGLTDADFRADPFRRYAASALDRMDWWRGEARLRYSLTVGDAFDVDVVGYRQVFDRGWKKLNRFADGPELTEILADPSGRRGVYQGVLTGEADSAAPGETLRVGLNQRDFVSEGVQLTSTARFRTGPIAHRPELGLRLHHDRIRRTHTEDPFVMRAGDLVPEGGGTLTTVANEANAVAFAAHIHYEAELGPVTLTPGARLEVIDTELTDSLTDTLVTRTDTVLLPGIGAVVALSDAVDVLGGVYQGFSPVSPGQAAAVRPEKSLNYEAGARVHHGAFGAELVGFWNDYENLTGECGLSTGCAEELIGQQFNGGSVHVWGAELGLSHRFELPSVALPARVAYTFTDSAFQTAFASENPEFGEVAVGDALPYVPEHQASVTLGLERSMWSVTTVTTYVGEMREQAGSGGPLAGKRTDDYLMVDVAAEHDLFDGSRLYLRVDNFLGVQPIASRRPFGARPVKPLLLLAGLKLDF